MKCGAIFFSKYIFIFQSFEGAMVIEGLLAGIQKNLTETCLPGRLTINFHNDGAPQSYMQWTSIYEFWILLEQMLSSYKLVCLCIYFVPIQLAIMSRVPCN